MKTAERIVLVQLLRAYKSGEGLYDCPLCELHRDLVTKIVNCTECIWSKYFKPFSTNMITGLGCVHCFSWYEDIGALRACPCCHSVELSKDRIAMIYKWLEEDK